MGNCLAQSRQRMISQILQIEQYKIVKEIQIANGGYAQVWKCKDLKNSQLYALKQIKLQNQQLIEMFNREVQVMKILKNCRHTIKIFASSKIQKKQYSIGYILMEFAEMTLFDFLRNQKLQQKQIIKILLEISYGLQEIHSKNIYHLDLKAQNILIVRNNSQDTTYKICDYGSSIRNSIQLKKLDKKQQYKLLEYIQANSTLIYRSPEMIDIHFGKQIGSKSDIWMLGCIAYLLLYRKHPFEQSGKLGIVSCNVDYKNMNNQLVKILKQIFIHPQQNRIGLSQLIEYLQNFLKDNQNNLKI